MGKIKIFPQRIEKEKIGILSVIRKELKKYGFAEDMEKEILSQMSTFLDFISDVFKFPQENMQFSNEQLLFIQDRLRAHTNAIIFDRLTKEIEVYNLRHRDEF
jgi:hypothetical protein